MRHCQQLIDLGCFQRTTTRTTPAKSTRKCSCQKLATMSNSGSTSSQPDFVRALSRRKTARNRQGKILYTELLTWWPPFTFLRSRGVSAGFLGVHSRAFSATRTPHSHNLMFTIRYLNSRASGSLITPIAFTDSLQSREYWPLCLPQKEVCKRSSITFSFMVTFSDASVTFCRSCTSTLKFRFL